MIKFLLGLLIVFGSVGELDYNPDANLFVQFMLASFGLLLMYFGTKSFQE